LAKIRAAEIDGTGQRRGFEDWHESRKRSNRLRGARVFWTPERPVTYGRNQDLNI